MDMVKQYLLVNNMLLPVNLLQTETYEENEAESYG